MVALEAGGATHSLVQHVAPVVPGMYGSTTFAKSKKVATRKARELLDITTSHPDGECTAQKQWCWQAHVV